MKLTSISLPYCFFISQINWFSCLNSNCFNWKQIHEIEIILSHTDPKGNFFQSKCIMYGNLKLPRKRKPHAREPPFIVRSHSMYIVLLNHYVVILHVVKRIVNWKMCSHSCFYMRKILYLQTLHTVDLLNSYNIIKILFLCSTEITSYKFRTTL